MMRLLLGLLMVANLLVFLFGVLPQSSVPKASTLVEAPDVGSLRVMPAQPREAEPEEVAQEPAPVEPEPQPELEPEPEPELEVVEEGGPVAGGEEEESSMEGVPEPPAAQALAATEEAPAPAEEPPVAPASHCGLLGPFESPDRGERLARRLGLASFTLEARTEMVDKSYWVMIPPLPNREAAGAMVERLRAAGVDDLWLMPKGELRNGISLGLYTRKVAAYRHAERLRKKGFQVEVRTKQQAVERYWLGFEARDPHTWARLQETTLPSGIQLKEKPCEQASPAL